MTPSTDLSPRQLAMMLTEDGLGHLEARRFPEAREDLEDALAADPTYQRAYGPLARACLETWDRDACIEYASAGLERFPRDVECLELRARAYLSLFAAAEAEQDAALALKYDRASVDARITLGAALLAQHKPAECLKELALVPANARDRVDYHLLAASAHQVVRDANQARASLVRAGELEPHNWMVYQGLAQLALLEDDAESGLAHANLAMALGGATPNLHSLRSIFLRVLKRYDEAKRELEAVLRANPSDASAWLMHAEIVALNVDQRGQAVDEARIALRLDPANAVHSSRARQLLRHLGVDEQHVEER